MKFWLPYNREPETRQDVENNESNMAAHWLCIQVIFKCLLLIFQPMLTIPIGMPGAGGYREHDILIVNEDGAENITKYPLGPEHNIIGSL